MRERHLRSPNASHWGMFTAQTTDGVLTQVSAHPQDPDPSPLLGNIVSGVYHRSRVDQPMVRSGWLRRGPGPSDKRGRESFVPVSWDEALDLVAAELSRVRESAGNDAIFGGSYGWASAGRFHHAQSQVHRFLNCIGGYVSSVNSYSVGVAQVILPHIIGTIDDVVRRTTAWPVVAASTELFVAFGGMAEKNVHVAAGGVGRHLSRGYLDQAHERGAQFVLFSPIRDDLPDRLDARWHPLRPGTDTAVMLALAYVLITEGLYDEAFLASHCVGFDTFAQYVLGRSDGVPKTPAWAEAISEVSATEIATLARRMAASRTMINISWSLQRAQYGEQPLWMAITLAAMLGQVGLPGGGFAHGYGASAEIGRPVLGLGLPTFDQGRNPVDAFIPVARIADMLLHPGARYDYDGMSCTYPDIRLVYWCGGNPFHHHQDLFRLRRAFTRPDTIIVHEPFWTSSARQADIVLPSTTTLERNDIGCGRNDPYMTKMAKAIEPIGLSRNDYDIFVGLAERLGVGHAFSEGRDELGWLRHIYEEWRASLRDRVELPSFEQFWSTGEIELPSLLPHQVMFSEFHEDPGGAPLITPSGTIEIFSSTIDSFAYDDCPGHPSWIEPTEWLGSPETSRFPLHLIANNPRTRLHSQLDVGDFSQSSKINGREPVRMHPADASLRSVTEGDIVRVFNDRGSCLAGVVLTDALRPGVVQLSTGAWFDPVVIEGIGEVCAHGNPNVLTADIGSSSLSQGCSGQHALVEVEKFEGTVPELTVLDPPAIAGDRRR